MRRFIPLILLGLAACDSPLEDQHPRQAFTFVEGKSTYDVSAQFDPFVQGFYVRIADRVGRLEEDQRSGVQLLLAANLTEELCEEDEVLYQVRDGTMLTGWGKRKERYLSDLGEWQFVMGCASMDALER